jgi:F-box-like
MTPAPKVSAYFASNDTPPEDIRALVSSFVHSLDRQDNIYEKEIRPIDEAISSKRQLIAALEDEVQRLGAIRARIHGLQLAIRSTKNEHQAVLSAVRRIPAEVVASIIAFAITGRHGHVEAQGRTTFLVLRRVSRLWRQTAFSTPVLWRNLCFQIRSPNYIDIFPLSSQPLSVAESRWPANWRVITSWLSRGGKGAPLSIIYFDPLPRYISELLQMISTVDLNVSFLLLEFPRGDYVGSPAALDILSSYREKPLPIKTLLLPFPSLSRPGHLPPRVNLNQQVPLLANLALSFDHVPRFPTMVSLVHKDLTRLELAKANLAETHTKLILGGLPQLRFLFLHDCHITPRQEDEEIALFAHPSLQDIEFSYGVPERLLRGLTCPRLQSASLCCSPMGGLEVPPACGRYFGEFIDRCGSPIEFAFFGLYPPIILHNILAASSNIERLCISNLSALTPTETIPGSDDRLRFVVPPSITDIFYTSIDTGEEEHSACFDNLKVIGHDVRFHARGALFGTRSPTRPTTPEGNREDDDVYPHPPS